MRLIRLGVLVLACVVSAASAGGQSYRARPIERPAGATDSDMYSAAVAVLSDRGKTFRTQDRESGVLVTEWDQFIIGLTPYRHAWRVTLVDGQLRLNIDCMREIDQPFVGKSWKTCEDDFRSDDWTSQAPRLLADIQAEVPRQVARRRDKEAAAAPVRVEMVAPDAGPSQ